MEDAGRSCALAHTLTLYEKSDNSSVMPMSLPEAVKRHRLQFSQLQISRLSTSSIKATWAMLTDGSDRSLCTILTVFSSCHALLISSKPMTTEMSVGNSETRAATPTAAGTNLPVKPLTTILLLQDEALASFLSSYHFRPWA